MTALAVSNLPAGLVLAPSVSTPRTWELHHRASGIPVIKDCPTRESALRAGLALSGIDWERDAGSIADDDIARAVYAAVQFEVFGEAHRHGRRS